MAQSVNLIIEKTGWKQDYILSLGFDRISDLSAYFVKSDATQKMWELQLTSLGYQPQTSEDSFKLSNKYDELIDLLENQIRIADGNERKEDYYDGQIRMT